MKGKKVMKKEVKKEFYDIKRKQCRREHSKTIAKQRILALLILGLSILLAIISGDGTASILMSVFALALFVTKNDMLLHEEDFFIDYKVVKTGEVYSKEELKKIFEEVSKRKGYCFEEWLYDLVMAGALVEL